MVRHRCNNQMHECERQQAGSDGVGWWCTSCKTTRSIRTNSFFVKSKLTLQQWFLIIVWWAWQYPVSAASAEVEVTEATACQVYEWLQEVCSTTLLQTPIILSGPGVIVQVDESQFHPKPKVHWWLKWSFNMLNPIYIISIAQSWARAMPGCLGVWIS